MIGNWAKTTTTTASGTTACAGLTAVSGYPTINELTTNPYFWYVILDASDKPLEAGIGKKTSSTAFDRLKVSKTYSGATYDDTDPTALTLVNGTTYNVIMTAIDASVYGAMPGVSTTYWTKGITSAVNGTFSNLAMVDDRQYLIPFMCPVAGVLKGFVVDVNTAGANSSCQAGLYALNHNGEAITLLARTADFSTATTGSKSPATTANIWVAPGWYAVSLCSKNAVDTVAPTVRATGTPTGGALPWGFNNSGGNMTETNGSLYKAQAGWTDLADVDTTTGWTAQIGGSVAPLVALLFE